MNVKAEIVGMEELQKYIKGLPNYIQKYAGAEIIRQAIKPIKKAYKLEIHRIFGNSQISRAISAKVRKGKEFPYGYVTMTGKNLMRLNYPSNLKELLVNPGKKRNYKPTQDKINLAKNVFSSVRSEVFAIVNKNLDIAMDKAYAKYDKASKRAIKKGVSKFVKSFI